MTISPEKPVLLDYQCPLCQTTARVLHQRGIATTSWTFCPSCGVMIRVQVAAVGDELAVQAFPTGDDEQPTPA